MNARPVIPVLFSFIAGILFASCNIIDEWTAFSILTASLLLAILSLIKRVNPYPAICLSFFLAGLLLTVQETNPSFPPDHIKNIVRGSKKEKVNIQGVVYRSPEKFIDKTRLYVEVERVFNGDNSIPVSGRILLTIKSPDTAVKYGDRIRFISKIHAVRNFGNPGEFDHKWHLEREGIYVTGFVENENWIVRLEGGSRGWIWTAVEDFRNNLAKLIDNTFDNTDGKKVQGIMKALLIGEGGEIERDVREAFAMTGTSHILAISGLHIGIVAFVVYSICCMILLQSEKLALAFNIKKLSAAASIPFILFYGLMAGFPVSTQRAVIMIIVFIAALVSDRERDMFNTLALAAFIILIISPSALYNISFQLSFASVFAIIYLAPKFKLTEPAASFAGHMRDRVLTGLFVSIAATLGTAPIAAYHFHRVSIIGVFANLIVVPVIGFIAVPLELLAGLIYSFSESASVIIMQTAAVFIKFSVWIVELFSRLPYSFLWVAAPTIFEAVIFYLLVISLAESMKRAAARYALIVFSFVFLLDHAYWYSHLNYNKDLKVTFLSIGQGDSSLVEFPQGKRMLIDGGGFYDSDFDTGERIIAPFLWKNKIKNIDYLVMSHPQSDHFKGLRFIAKNFNVKEFWWNGDNAEGNEYSELMQILEDKMVKKRVVSADIVNINGAKVESLNPLKFGEMHDKNNISVVMRISYGDVSFLFTGDIEKAGEEAIVKSGRDIKADVLKVPHHGSRTSSTLDFISAVSPGIAVMSVGYGNPFNFPHREVVERYRRLNTKVMRTDIFGAITIRTDGRIMDTFTFL